MKDEDDIMLHNGLRATKEQYESMTRLVLRYKKEPDSVALEIGAYGAVICSWDGLFIGIERDGYAHS